MTFFALLWSCVGSEMFISDRADAVCARFQLPESPVVHRHKIADIFELRLLEQHPKRECCGHLMLAEFRIWAVAIDIRHHAVTEAKIDSIPFSALHIGNVLCRHLARRSIFARKVRKRPEIFRFRVLLPVPCEHYRSTAETENKTTIQRQRL